MAALFALFFPIGAIIMRLSRSSNAAWFHGAWQSVSYIGALAGFGIGAYLATVEDNVSLLLGVLGGILASCLLTIDSGSPSKAMLSSARLLSEFFSCSRLLAFFIIAYTGNMENLQPWVLVIDGWGA
jgi:hypothetical protein